MNVAVESLVIDGDKNGHMGGCDRGEKGYHAPFALFSPDLQHNVGGPYATWDHAHAALQLCLKGKMVPYTDRADVTFTVKGKPSKWYDQD